MTNSLHSHVQARVKASFDKQNAMQLIRASIPVIAPGKVEIHVPQWSGIEQ